MPAGRPSSYSQELADIICERIANGESIRRICQDEGMPGTTTIMRWLASDDENYAKFRIQYARAREIQADKLFDECLEIADDSANDTITDEYGNDRADHEWIGRSRLRVDTRKWMAGKLRPKVYGNNTQVDMTVFKGAVRRDPVEADAKRLAQKDEWASKHANGKANGNGTAH